MNKKVIEPISPERYVYKGNIISVVNQDMRVGKKEITFEKARRTPGVRLLITNSTGELLVSKEYRHETDTYDFRLPGGKVFDSLDDYLKKLDEGTNLEVDILKASRVEALEELGLEIHNPKIISKSVSGATIDWDLYYISVTEFSEAEAGQELEHGEDISTQWIGKSELSKLVKDGTFSENRSIAVLYREGII